MRTRLLPLMLVLSFTSLAWSAPRSKTRVKITQKDEGLSQKNREGKKFGVNVTPMGLTHNALSSSIEGNYFFRKDTIFSLQYTDMQSGLGTIDEEKYSADELNVWKRNGKGMSISGGVKQFFGNSFYAKGEVYYRNQDHINKTGSKIKPGTINEWVVTYKETGRIEDIGFSFKVGNQWQWDNLTVGCDWFGLNRNFNTISKRGSLEEEDINTINLLNLYVGASF